jgi:hypothetical protein
MSLIRADIPTIVIGMKDIGFANAGINSYNTYKIIKIADPFESFNPLDPINAITGFEKDAAYFFFAKETIDLTGIADNAVPVNLDTTSGNNVFANMAFAGVAKTTASFATVGFNTSNLLWIYKVSDPYESYNPNDPYNPIDGFEVNECYYGYALADMDLNAYLIPPIVIKDDVEKATDTYKYWGTEATTDKDFYNVPVRFFADEASLPTTGIENIVYVAKSEKTSWYWDGSAYQQIGGGGGITSETDPTVPTLVKNIPVSADATTNKYLNWNGSAYTRKQVDYSELTGTSPLGNLFANGGIVNISTSTAYTVQNSDGYITFSGSGCHCILPNPASHNGRIIQISASNYTGGLTFNSPYFPKYNWMGNGGGMQDCGFIAEGITCTLISNGTNWIMAARSLGASVVNANDTTSGAQSLVGGDPSGWGLDGENSWSIRKLIPGTGITLTPNSSTGLIISSSGIATTPGIDDVLAVGQALTTSRTIAAGVNRLDMTGSNSSGVLKATSSSGAAASGALVGIGNSCQGVQGASTTGTGASFSSNSSYGLASKSTSGVGGKSEVNPSSTNTVVTVHEIIRTTSSTAANGIGGSIDYVTELSDGNVAVSNRIASVWSNATNATRTSQLVFKGVNAATTVDVMTLGGEGYMQLNGITATAASAITPSDGMIVYVNSTNATFTSVGFWARENGTWIKL